MILGLIPARLHSKRLEKKSLIKIDGIPMIVHTFKRVMLSKKIDKVIVCTDSTKIKKIVEENGGTAVLTSSQHSNGTERISEVSKKFKSKLVIDIQGDEPFVSPKDIDKLVTFHLKNKNFDIVLPSQISSKKENQKKNIVKVIKSKKNRILYLSRSNIPYEYSKKNNLFLKHYSIISFKPKKLGAFAKLKKSNLESIEGVELLRALENDFSIGTFIIKSRSFAVDVNEDLKKAKKLMPKDNFRRLY
ncbi:3-deoxy-manno-octulosonate cytidylyltransferase [Pelagibacterales bacterium SAG-MED05]|nr:3-deoxy-manno-octulosonate cytidylyltransferase [Pelagibacterales bacterium SAG-MED05]